MRAVTGSCSRESGRRPRPRGEEVGPGHRFPSVSRRLPLRATPQASLLGFSHTDLVLSPRHSSKGDEVCRHHLLQSQDRLDPGGFPGTDVTRGRWSSGAQRRGALRDGSSLQSTSSFLSLRPFEAVGLWRSRLSAQTLGAPEDSDGSAGPASAKPAVRPLGSFRRGKPGSCLNGSAQTELEHQPGLLAPGLSLPFPLLVALLLQGVRVCHQCPRVVHQREKSKW